MFSAIILGIGHAFEVDHLLAMSSIVTKKSKWSLAVREGAYWGMGHTSTILVVGVIMILLRVAIPTSAFHYFEALVGIMLIGLGSYRIIRFFKNNKVIIHKHPHYHEEELPGHKHAHSHLHMHINDTSVHHHAHLSYGVGLIHGLAGSGELVIAAAALYLNPWMGLSYLFLFGTGTIFGMMVATGLLHMPFTQKAILSKGFSVGLAWLSAMLCIGFGTKIMYSNLHLVL